MHPGHAAGDGMEKADRDERADKDDEQLWSIVVQEVERVFMPVVEEV